MSRPGFPTSCRYRMSVTGLTYFVCRPVETGNFADKTPVSFLHARYGVRQKSIELFAR